MLVIEWFRAAKRWTLSQIAVKVTDSLVVFHSFCLFWVALLSEVRKEVGDVCYVSWDMMEEWGSKGCSGWLPLEKCSRSLLTSLSFSLPCCRHWKPSVPTCIFTVVAFPLLCPANVLYAAAVGICSFALRRTMFRKAGMDIRFVCSVNGESRK